MQPKKINKNTKVAFVEPAGAHANVFAKFMTIPMLGPLYLGTIAEKEGYDVSILNENILGKPISAAELEEVDILCLSCMTATVDRGREIAKQYKELRKQNGLPSRTIIGGIHASMIPDDVMNDFDQVFIGEAESKILDVISGKIQDKRIFGEKLQDLDRNPVPNFQLIKNWEKMKCIPVMTSRGCPFKCTFCSVTEMFGRKYRTRSVENVIEELKQYKKNQIFFVDDHFVLDQKRTRNLLNSMESNNIDLKWSCQLRTEISRNEDFVARMQKMGCKTVYVGFESINPDSLKEMKKNQTVEDIKHAINVFRKNGIKIHGMFMLGNDSDQKDIFRLTSDFCKNIGLTSVQYLILTPLPGTVFFNQIVEEQRLLHRNWEFFDAMHVVFQPKNFTPSELQQGMIDCFSDFYSYSKAINDAINVFFETVPVLVDKMYKNAHLPSLVPSIIKVFGRRIVKDWISHNKPYLNYLNILSLNLRNRS